MGGFTTPPSLIPATVTTTPRNLASNAKLIKTNTGQMIKYTSGTFSQAFDPAATLQAGWFVYVSNPGTGFVTLDPSGAETITPVNGIAQPTRVLWPKESGILICDGVSNFDYYRFTPGEITQTVSGNPSSISFATGMSYRNGFIFTVENLSLTNSARLELKLNNTESDSNKSFNINGAGSASTTNPNNGGTDLNVQFMPQGMTGGTTGIQNARVSGEITFGVAESVTQYQAYYYNGQYNNMNGIGFWTTINAAGLNSVDFVLTANAMASGSFTIREM